MITIVGLGAGAGDLTLKASCALLSGRPIYLRTERHPVCGFLQEQGLVYETLDALYESCADYDELMASIASSICQADPCVYGVPGSASLSDEGVRAVYAAAKQLGLDCEIIPGVGYYEQAAAQCGGFSGAVCLPAADYDAGAYNPRLPLILQEMHSRLVASEAKLRLLEVYPAEHEVYLDGCKLPLEELDRQESYDHLSCVCVPPLDYTALERFDLEGLRQVLRRLRDPLEGCPWDKVQTHESLRRDLLEECYEVLGAIDEGDPDHLLEELGDVLLQVGMHAQIAEEQAEFNLRDVFSAICRKMIERHPHVFGTEHLDTADQVVEVWNERKRVSRGQQGQAEAMADLPLSLPALLRAEKVQKLAKPLGYDFASPAQAHEKLLEEANEVLSAGREDLEMELGDLLFACVNVARLNKINGEIALNRASDKFIARIKKVEELARTRGVDLKTLDEKQLDVYWEEAKSLLKNPT